MCGSLSVPDLHRAIQMSGVSPNSFVETGTCRGETAETVAKSGLFPGGVWTIEASEQLYQFSKERLSGIATVVFGRSEECLLEVLSKAPGPRMIYLDAHQTFMDSRSAKGACPLNAEIDAIRSAGGANIVIVDDCRLFGTNSPQEHQDWTDISADSLAERLGVKSYSWLDPDRAIYFTGQT